MAADVATILPINAHSLCPEVRLQIGTRSNIQRASSKYKAVLIPVAGNPTDI
jgi:hypothetical protein